MKFELAKKQKSSNKMDVFLSMLNDSSPLCIWKKMEFFQVPRMSAFWSVRGAPNISGSKRYAQFDYRQLFH